MAEGLANLQYSLINPWIEFASLQWPVRCAGMQAELGFTVRGTTDAALVLQQSIAVGAAANGLRWLWELKRQLHAPTEEMPARTPYIHLHQAPAMQLRCERVAIRMLLRPQNAFASEASIVPSLRVCTFLVKVAMIQQA